LLMVDGLLFAGFRLRQSDSQLKPPPPSTSRLNSPYTTSDFSSLVRRLGKAMSDEDGLGRPSPPNFGLGDQLAQL
ncbi:hypothetical protein KDX27_35185, partial [Burkholderia cenocepacia]|uniref:hypothetical protein n=1 Tax=Burkholderia cenocepacia TaxID=95486 RepID=UPI001B9F9301